MPKATSQKKSQDIFAKDDVTGQRYLMNRERYHGQFDHIGRQTKKEITVYPRPHTRILTREEQIEYLLEAEREAAEKSLLNRLTIERRLLIDRITNPPLPLIERISEPGPSQPTYTPPLPIPNSLHFVQTKKLKRLEDLNKVLTGLRVALDPVFEHLRSEEENERFHGIRPRVSKEIRDNLWGWYDEVQEIGLREQDEWRKYTNKQWRYLFGNLKKIKKVSTENPKDRLSEICTQLYTLKIDIPKVE